jgi:TPR repeat protein
MSNLGAMYANGAGVTKDPTEAVSWYRKAADAGDTQGMNNLGIAYLNGVGAPRDKAEALRWYRKAADLGDDRAKASLRALGVH